MNHSKGNRIVVCKTCEREYIPSGRPYKCTYCRSEGFWLSPHEFEIQLLIRESRNGNKAAYEKLGKEIFVMTKKLIWPYIWDPMQMYVDEIVSEVILHFFKVYERTTKNDHEEIRCVYALLNFLASRLSAGYSRKILDHLYRTKPLSIIGEDEVVHHN